MTDYLVVHTTFETKEDAMTMATLLVDKRLVACGQIDGPISSVYWWENQVVNSDEWRLTLKTKRSAYKKLEAMILIHHPYDVPQIVCLSIEKGSRDYLNWIEEEVSEAVD